MVFNNLVRARWLVLTALVIVVTLTIQRALDMKDAVLDPDGQLRGAGYPVDAVEWARANPDKIGTVLFNEYGQGGFLVWKFPEQKVFVDGRMPYWQMGDRFPFVDEQAATHAEANSIENLVQKYGVDWVMIGLGRPLDWALRGQSDWERVYFDDTEIIYRYRLPNTTTVENH